MNYLFRGIVIFLGLLSICGVLQLKIIEYTQMQLFYSVWNIYIFHSITAICIFSIIYGVYKWQSSYVGYAFLVSTLLQMLASIVFLIPLISVDITDKTADVFSFISPYFICLFSEMIFATILINKK